MISGSYRAALISGVFLAALLLSGCHPYGKPALEEVDPEKSTDFATLFAQNCRGCHGDNGKYGPGRILNDPLYVAFIPREEIKKVLTYGRPGTAMPAWAQSQGGPLSEKQIDVLVSGIKDDWAKPVDLHGTTLPVYSTDINAGDATRGKRLFVRACFACHGQGAPVGVITNATYLQLSSNQNLRTSIVVGRPDVPVKKMLMPNYMYLNAGHALTDQDVSDLVTYIASFRPAQQTLEGAHTKENINAGESGGMAAGNQGSGNGPGSPDKGQNKGQKHTNSSIQGGTVQGHGPQH
jgi:cytochrome c oxidase cbb3-type subunit III